MPATRKERADAVMAASRRCAEREKAIVLLAAKANRASWSHKNPSDNMDSLSAGMDSSSIEYDSDALFFLSGDPATKSFLHVRKNRPGDGTKPTIALGFDFVTASFAEIDQDVATVEEEEAQMEKAAAKWSADENRVVRTVREYPGRSGNVLARLLEMNRQRCSDLLAELDRKSEIELRGKGWHVTSGVSGDEKDE
jgi:hypothetical protein